MSVTSIKRSRHKGEMRRGYTTGACATAAALAALKALLTGQAQTQSLIDLPIGEQAQFDLHRCRPGQASVIKDAGDDPDCTHGAEIGVDVELTKTPGIRFFAGSGVATVTKPGLELAVGEPAINPVPRKMIKQHLLPLLPPGSGVKVTVWITDGEKLAEQTIGRRLGLIGGLSILGTRGTVHPYSTSAYAASVRQGIEVARAQGLNHAVLTTGSRTERAAMLARPNMSESAFIQAGDFSGVGLRAGARFGMERLTLVTMIGKLCKLAGGTTMTHVSGRAINFALMADTLAECGGDADLCQQVREANTGRHLLELIPSTLKPQFLNALCQLAAAHCYRYAHHKLAIEVELLDFDGAPLAFAAVGELK
ncbi:cobalt-precorrin-5B (C(1))-methyltransferase [Ferrimonas aestuarii]|uniref:cobalt-precorrin-5B (C(1))-methyltransferase n=1 Tax=Ferrimonas aestuarii TaxID=2569539 RepID=UPI00197ADC70|nr:cobalt-precorrin-5B (C(1))-methyltransferase [Ferrimonas aestuarii]